MSARCELKTRDLGTFSEMLDELHRRGWSVGVTRFEEPFNEETWVVSCIRGHGHIYAEDSERDEAWGQALEQARELDLLMEGEAVGAEPVV